MIIDILKKKLLGSREELFFKIKESKPLLITYVNAYGYLAFRNKTKLLSKYDIVLSDGMLITAIFRHLLNLKIVRYSPDMAGAFGNVFDWGAKTSSRFFFVGASEKEIQSSIKHITQVYNIEVIGYHHGYFLYDENIKSTLIKEIITSLFDDRYLLLDEIC